MMVGGPPAGFDQYLGMTKQSLNRQQEFEFDGQEDQVKIDLDELDDVFLLKEDLTKIDVDSTISCHHATKHTSTTP